MALSAQVTRIDEPGKRPRLHAHAASHTTTRKVALLGFGTVGRAVADILCHDAHLRLTHVFNRNIERKRAAWVPESVHWTESFQDVLKSDSEIVLELMGGLEPAHECIRQALQSGKSVVTANKQVMAKYGLELLELARQHGQHLEYGASVGGAVPVLAALRYGLAGDRLVRARGILNGTCNYILSNMEANGTTMAAALAQAQRLGYAEGDPSDDVNGLDAACKLAIVARLGLQAELNPFEVPKQSICAIQTEDFLYARQLGCTIRQLSTAELHADKLQATVGPALIPLKSPLSTCIDNQNAVIFTGEKSGDTLLAGRGAGGQPTAVAVVSDALAISDSESSRLNGRSVKSYAPEPLSCRHYVRLKDGQTDFIPLSLQVLHRYGVRIEGHLDCSQTAKAFLLETCSSVTAQNAITEIAEAGGQKLSVLCLPMPEFA